VDCGLNTSKAEGSFAKHTGRRGTRPFEPLHLFSRDEIRSNHPESGKNPRPPDPILRVQIESGI
jgi:hypothetical protein